MGLALSLLVHRTNLSLPLYGPEKWIYRVRCCLRPAEAGIRRECYLLLLPLTQMVGPVLAVSSEYENLSLALQPLPDLLHGDPAFESLLS